MLTQTTSSYHQTRLNFDEKRNVLWRELCRYFGRKYIPNNAKILELGAGYCHFINQIPGAEKHALDTFPDLPHHAAPDVVPHVHSCTQRSSLPSGSLDIVFASNLFEHLTRLELIECLHEVKRVLRPGGKLILVQPNFKYCFRDYFDDYTHLQVFTHVGLSDLVGSKGFKVTTLKPKFMPFSMKSGLPVSALLIRLYLKSPLKPFAGQMLLVAEKPGKE